MGHNSAWLFLILALGLLILPIWWVAAAVLAAVWHEACHYFALRITGGLAMGLHWGLSGARMEVRFTGVGQEIICAVAGPLGSLLLLLFSRWLPRTAICAAFHGIYNLLPVYPLDGGRIVRCMAQLFLPEKWREFVCLALERLCLLGVIAVALFGSFGLHLGFGPMIVGATILWRVKRPCKPWRNSVQ